MESLVQSFLLGLVQGLTEFLPISSSAHLVLLPWLFHWNDPGLDMDVALHGGTLIAVLVYYRRTWFEIFSTICKRDRVPGAYPFLLLKYLLLASIPAAIAGFFLESYAEKAFRHPLLIASTLIGFSFVLWLADTYGKKKERSLIGIHFWDALCIGIAQVFAIVPGFSRAATTISTALFLGFKREEAAHFSFLLSTPIIGAAVVLRVPSVVESKLYSTSSFWLGIGIAALSGYMAIHVLVKFVSKNTYLAFVVYRIALGVFILSMYFLRNP